MILNVWIEMFAAPRTICFSLPMHCENLAWWQQKNADDLCHKLLLVKNPTQIFFSFQIKHCQLQWLKIVKTGLKLIEDEWREFSEKTVRTFSGHS